MLQSLLYRFEGSSGPAVKHLLGLGTLRVWTKIPQDSADMNINAMLMTLFAIEHLIFCSSLLGGSKICSAFFS